MGSPPVIVDRPIPNRHLQMAFVERKQEVETFATKAAAESFAHRVRLWGPQRRPQNPYTQIGKTSVDIRREYAVAIVDDEAVGMVARQRFPELLQRRFRRGMGRGVEVENLAGSDLHDQREPISRDRPCRSACVPQLAWPPRHYHRQNARTDREPHEYRTALSRPRLP